MTGAAGSFRDPTGACRITGQRVVRTVGEEDLACFEKFLKSNCAHTFVQNRQLVSTRRLEASEVRELDGNSALVAPAPGSPESAVFEHERIVFRSFAYEWPPEMLWQAAKLTLDLALAALDEGFEMKDATPYNVLFRGPEPVFVDVPSFSPRRLDDPMWQAYGQFVRTFLLPLLANRQWGVRLADIFITHRDGLEPEEVYPWCSFWQKLQPRNLSMVSIPTWLRGKAQKRGEELYRARKASSPEKAEFIVRGLLRQLDRKLTALKPSSREQSGWSQYMLTHSYSEPGFDQKSAFVRTMLDEFNPRHVLDVGANTGYFSFLTAKSGAEVVAIDLDAACVGAIWRESQAQNLNILPLVVDFCRPTPAIGWRNLECPSFFERAAGGFDCVLMLAVIHHFLVTERVPLVQILETAAGLTEALLLVEFVPPGDPMFQVLTRGRDKLHSSLNQALFETACAEQFEILRSASLSGTGRRLYLLRRRARPAPG